MPSNAETLFRSRFPRPLALLALALMLSAGLAGCGGGSGGGGQVMIVPGPSPESPDLIVESFSADGGVPAAGEGFTLSATVRNAGGGPAAAATVRFYRSADATITPSDEEETTKALEGPAAEGSVAASVDLTAPSNPGAYYYGACVDAVEGESDTTNNCSAPVRLSVQELRSPALEARVLAPAPQIPGRPGPDMVVTNAYVRNTNPFASESLFLSATVRNAGDRAVSTVRVNFWFSRDATLTESDVSGGSVEIGAVGLRPDPTKAIAPSAERDATKNSIAPSNPGVYYYGACVDPPAGESDTTDNCQLIWIIKR